jgi:tetratricopeptide (TPR) repeat protein
MRAARQARAVEAADRALAIAERLNLEPIIAEALVNKGSAINLMGRRREAAALEEAALTLARRTGDRGLEIRIRNNLASAIIVDDPIRATRMYQEARELAADLGDRGMYNWLSGLIALNTFTMGGDVDAEIAILRDALDAATLRPDRIRLRMIRGVLEAQRGVAIPELRTEVEELVGDSTDPEQLFSRHMARAFTALMIGNGRESYDEAMAAFELTPQNPEVPLGNAIRSAVLLRDAERAATVAGHITALGQSGDLDRSSQLGAQAVVAALTGRGADALAAFRDSYAIETRLGQRLEAAVIAVHAVELLPGEPEPRAWAEEARPFLVEFGLRPWLERLDAALALAVPSSREVSAAPAPAPAAPVVAPRD